MSKGKNPQKEHYEAVHDAYEAHYYDEPSMQYRRKFIYGNLFKGVSLDDMLVADLACGSGHNSKELKRLFPSVQTVGFDISESACSDYERNVGKAYQSDLTMDFTPPHLFDGAMVIGGIHHCVNDLETFFRNISRMIKPGGLFFMMEPNGDFFLNTIREQWYKKDKWFEENSEAALSHDDILSRAQPYFALQHKEYFGGPAFYLILNSLITRVPLRSKPPLSRILFPLESLFNAIPCRSAFAAFTAVWKRTEASL